MNGVFFFEGGVDISIDPFETIGFSRVGALARRDMRVYDRDANGFFPGEGTIVVLHEDDHGQIMVSRGPMVR